ncbi:MAG: DUF1475 family protein [Planctomycetota bacterium]|jgi:hypothetical protein
MRIAITVLTVGVLVMTASITYALMYGEFFQEAEVLFEFPWFHLSMIDLYTGFFLFSGWILYRERSLPVAVAWIVLVLTLGNLTSCLYALVAAARANGEWRTFWLGARNRELQ